MSSIVRGAAAGRPTPLPAVASSRGRVIHGDAVGLRVPIAIEVKRTPAASTPGTDLLDEEELFTESSASLAELEELREAAKLQGYDEGYEQGHAAGVAAAESRLLEEVERLTRLVASVREDHSSFYRAAERQVVDLALQVAQKVVEHEVENIPDLAVGVIRAALEEMDVRTVVRVRVSPEDHEVVRRRWAVAVPPTADATRIELAADPGVQGGGAIVETKQGEVDAQLETKLAQLGNALWGFTALAEEDLTDEPAGDT